MFDWLPATLARHGQTRERELGREPLGALRQTVNKGVDRCVSLTTSTCTWQWWACVPSRGGFQVQSKSYNVLCARREWPGTYISVPERGRGGVLFLLQAGGLPNQGPNGRQTGRSSKDAGGDGLRHCSAPCQDRHQASTKYGGPNNNNKNNNTTTTTLGAAAGQAGHAGRSGSMHVGIFPLFPRATPHRPATRGPAQ